MSHPTTTAPDLEFTMARQVASIAADAARELAVPERLPKELVAKIAAQVERARRDADAAAARFNSWDALGELAHVGAAGLIGSDGYLPGFDAILAALRPDAAPRALGPDGGGIDGQLREEMRRLPYRTSARRERAEFEAHKLRRAAVRAVTEDKPVAAADVLQLIDGIRTRGIVTFQGIARELNAQAIPGPRGGAWYGPSVKKLIQRG